MTERANEMMMIAYTEAQSCCQDAAKCCATFDHLRQSTPIEISIHEGLFQIKEGAGYVGGLCVLEHRRVARMFNRSSGAYE